MAAIYHFLIDRRTLTVLVLAGTLVGALLFFAGLLVGLHHSLEPQPVQTASAPAAATRIARPTATPQAPVRPAPTTVQPTVRVPPAPVVRAPVQPRPSVPTARLPTARTGVQVASATPAQTPATPQPTPEPETAPAAAASETAASQTPPAEPAPTETASLEPPAAAELAPAHRWTEPEPVVLPETYSIQVGAYREQRYLDEAMQDLQERGYSPYTVDITGAGGLVFRTVRIGRYRTRDEAVRAASEFEHREELTALVRSVPAQISEPQPALDTAGLPPGREPAARLAGL